jgi:uncharacterized membrane protein YphA (DoxX/SURF4 family)
VGRQIYVEIAIRAPLEEVWRLTQTPELHERWDLRFSSITYLPRPDENQPQRFRYATNIGLGVEVEGWGESVGSFEGDGRRASSLKFGSDDSKAIIREGSGYWKYEARPDGSLRFLTGYDYETRWGLIGRVIDSVAFRPLMGWATAWSFDRMRLWTERGVLPESSRRAAISHVIARIALASVFFWHGLVPKLIVRHPLEAEFLTLSGIEEGAAWTLVTIAGVGEMLWAALLIVLINARWPAMLSAVALLVLMIGAITVKPDLLEAPFNPFTLTVGLIALCAIDVLTLTDSPRASRCLRKPGKNA